MRAISIERARRTVMEATTSPRASFSFTLLRTISRGDADMAFLRATARYCMLARTREFVVRSDRGAIRYDIAIPGAPAPRLDEIWHALVSGWTCSIYYALIFPLTILSAHLFQVY